MIDYFHLEAYGISSVNYNRDLEVFPVLKNILNRIKPVIENCIFGEYMFDFNKQILTKCGEQIYLTDIKVFSHFHSN